MNLNLILEICLGFVKPCQSVLREFQKVLLGFQTGISNTGFKFRVGWEEIGFKLLGIASLLAFLCICVSGKKWQLLHLNVATLACHFWAEMDSQPFVITKSEGEMEPIVSQC